MKKYLIGVVLVLVSVFVGMNFAEATGGGSGSGHPPQVTINANPMNVNYGNSTTITWGINYYAATCTGSGGANGWAGSKNINGGSWNSGALTQTTTFYITCSNSYGSDSDAVTVTVSGQPVTPPSVDLSASQTNLNYNGSTNVNWTVSGNATSCNATNGTNGWSGAKSVSGGSFYTGALTNTTTYTITCSNSGGSASDSVTISVAGQPTNPPTVDLYASQTNLNYNEATVVGWSVTNATSCNATGGVNGWDGGKSASGGSFYTSNLTSTTTYTITCTNNAGQSATDTVTITVYGQPVNPPSVDLTASQMSINSGDATTLTWVSSNATSCNATNGTNGWSGSKSTSGGSFYTGALTNTTTYTITCTNSSGSASDTVTVSVNAQQNPPTVNLTASPSSIAYGASTVLTWTVTNATSCVANSNPATNWSNAKSSTGGQETISNLTSTTFFNLFCSGPGGSNSSTVTVTVGSQVNPPSVNLTASQMSINSGDATTLTWVTTGNATSCNATNGTNGWAGAKSISGGSFYTGALTNTTTYTITCSNSSGSASDTVTVSVNAQQNPPTVDLSATQNNLTYNGGTNIIWTVNNATSCNATNGMNGWAGNKSVSGGSFYTGNLTITTTYTITCTNSQGQTASDSVTVTVENQNVTPTVSTNSPTNTGYNNATLNGFVSANGGNSVTAWFEWGTSSGNLYTQTNQVNYGATNGTSYNYSLGGLTQNTTYYYRAAAQSPNGQIIYGSQMSFTTLNSNTGCTFNCGGNNQPNVTTYGATGVNENSANLNGYVNTNGTFTTVWFEWGQNSGALYNSTNKNGFGSNSGNFNQSISGLTPNTTYHYKAVAQNSSGTVYGNVLTFTTTVFVNTNVCGQALDCQPQAITTLATSITQTSARLNGLGLQNGGNVSINGYFEWGTTQSLGNRTTEGFIGSSASNPFFSNITGLSEGVTYYYRAVATNQYGTARGDITSFRTNRTVIINTGTSGNNDTIIYRNTGTNTTNVIRENTNTSTTNTNTINRNINNAPAVVVTNINDATGISRPSLVFLNVSNNGVSLNRLGTVDYFVTYKNVSGENLRDVVLSVLFPREMQFISTSAGYFSTENNTVVVNVGDLFPQQEGSVRISVRVLETAEINKTLVVTAHLAYTIVSNNTQEEVFAYEKDDLLGGGASALTGTALFGSGFWPNSLIGWLIFLLILVLILLAIRSAFGGNNQRNVGFAPIAPRRRNTKDEDLN